MNGVTRRINTSFSSFELFNDWCIDIEHSEQGNVNVWLRNSLYSVKQLIGGWDKEAISGATDEVIAEIMGQMLWNSKVIETYTTDFNEYIIKRAYICEEDKDNEIVK